MIYLKIVNSNKQFYILIINCSRNNVFYKLANTVFLFVFNVNCADAESAQVTIRNEISEISIQNIYLMADKMETEIKTEKPMFKRPQKSRPLRQRRETEEEEETEGATGEGDLMYNKVSLFIRNRIRNNR